MEKAKVDKLLTLSLTGGVWEGESQQKGKADFFLKFNFLLNALSSSLVTPFPAEL